MLQYINLIASVVIKCSILFFVYYIGVVIKNLIKKPINAYSLSEREYLRWKKNLLIIYSGLAGLYLLLFISAICEKEIGIYITLLGIIILYICKIRNNIKYIK